MTSSPFSILAVLLFFLFQLGVFAETKKLSIPIQQKLKETETPKPISWIVVPDDSGRSFLNLLSLINPPFKTVNFCMSAENELVLLDWQGMVYFIN